MSEAILTCALNRYDEEGNHRLCGVRAVSIWKSRDGDLPVCEQCEAIVFEAEIGAVFVALQ